MIDGVLLIVALEHLAQSNLQENNVGVSTDQHNLERFQEAPQDLLHTTTQDIELKTF